jgi:hypothetical protein
MDAAIELSERVGVMIKRKVLTLILRRLHAC